jgi:hypothetical protein
MHLMHCISTSCALHRLPHCRAKACDITLLYNLPTFVMHASVHAYSAPAVHHRRAKAHDFTVLYKLYRTTCPLLLHADIT